MSSTSDGCGTRRLLGDELVGSRNRSTAVLVEPLRQAGQVRSRADMGRPCRGPSPWLATQGDFCDGPAGSDVLVRPAQPGSFLIEVVRIIQDNSATIGVVATVVGVPTLSQVMWWATQSIRAGGCRTVRCVYGWPMPSQHLGGDFYLLGAGFSRAVSSAMPLLTELGAAVLDELHLSPLTLDPFGGSLEQWMSHISADQPWLSDSVNLENRAMFFRASQAVQSSIQTAETLVMRNSPPDWLLRLTSEMCATSSDIGTFNYDLIVERAMSSMRRVSTWTDLYAVSLEGRYPPGSTPFTAPNEPTGNVARLYKLHGSVNWGYGGPNGHPSSRIVLLQAAGGWGYASSGDAPRPRQQALYDDLVPMIVPPTSAKNAFYANLSLRAQWMAAHAALKRARRLIVVGFSFPASDLQVRHFLASAVLDGIEIALVNLLEDTAGSLRSVLSSKSVDVKGYFGERCVEDFVASNCGELIRWGVVPTDGDGWDTLLTANGTDALHFSKSGDRPFDRQADSSVAEAWLKSEINRRWPSINTESPTAAIDVTGIDGRPHYVAYASR